jgi:hypothetical protein
VIDFANKLIISKKNTWMRLEGFMLFHALITILGLAILLEPTEQKYPVLARLRQA